MFANVSHRIFGLSFFQIEQSCSNILLWNEGLYVTIFYPLDLLFDVFSIEDHGKVSLTS